MVDNNATAGAGELSLDAIFETLTHPMARHILKLLTVGPLSVPDLRQHLDLDTIQAGSALELLCRRGLARMTELNYGRLYHIDDRAFGVIRNWLAELETAS